MLKKIILVSLVFFVFSCAKDKKLGTPQVIPDSVYVNSANIKNSPLGKWKYINNQFFEFKGTEKGGTWQFYFDYGNKTKMIQFEGNWSVYQFNPQSGSGLLKLEYSKIGLSSEKLFPFKRIQIIEFYADENYFGMNIYRKSDGNQDFFGDWSHANYDWFDDAYVWSESPLWIAENDFKRKILNFIVNPEDKKFIEENCYEMRTGTLYKNIKLSGADEARLDTIIKAVKAKGGYAGDWFHVPFTSIPNMRPYYVNRNGKLTLKKSGDYVYEQKSPYFIESLGDVSHNLPDLNKPEINSDVAVTGIFNVNAAPLLNSKGQKSGEEVYLKLSNSSKMDVVGDWQFYVVVIKDKNLLLTYPFKKAAD